jgi:hypothetical protein
MDDHDIIDLSNPAEQHLEWIRSLVLARAPEASERDILRTPHRA